MSYTWRPDVSGFNALFLSIFFVSCIFGQPTAIAGRQDNGEQRIQIAKVAWKKASGMLLSSTMEVQTSLRDCPDASEMTHRISYGKQSTYMCVQYTRVQTNLRKNRPIREFVYCVNPRYAFRLARERGSENWVITSIATDATAKEEYIREFHQIAIPSLRLFYLQGCSLAQLFDSKVFKLVDTSNIELNGKELLRIRFENKHDPEKNGEFTNVQEGTLNLDPSAFYCLESADFVTATTESICKQEIRNEYDVASDGFPIPKAVNIGFDVSGTGGRFEYSMNVTYPAFSRPANSLRNSDFTLSHFGLPEPEFPTSGFWAYFLVGLVGAVLIGVGIVIRVRRSL